MAQKPRKPGEFKRFEELTRKLVAIPKVEIDAARKEAKTKGTSKPKPASGA